MEPNVASTSTSGRADLRASLQDLRGSLRGQRVLLRADLNVPLDGETITDDTRIRATVPTITFLQEEGARIVLASHLGRPKRGFEQKYSLKPVQPRLSQLLGCRVTLAPDCIGDEVAKLVAALQDGEVLLLENVRFYKGEEANDPLFAKSLAANADVYVNDAFGCAHRAHASTEGVTHFLSPCVAGLLMQKELDYLSGAVLAPARPFAAIVGGSKVSTKIGVLESLLSTCDKLVIGGGMVFTFLAAEGLPVGASLVERDALPLARRLRTAAAARGVQLLLPVDLVVADRFAADAAARTVAADAIPDGWMGLDIGPQSVAAVREALADCRTVIWNGPMGVFEFPRFAAGTTAIAHMLADLTARGCTTIVGGGDSVAAAEAAGCASELSHVSTGGGAALELLEGRTLPGVAALDEACQDSAASAASGEAASEASSGGSAARLATLRQSAALAVQTAYHFVWNCVFQVTGILLAPLGRAAATQAAHASQLERSQSGAPRL